MRGAPDEMATINRALDLLEVPPKDRARWLTQLRAPHPDGTLAAAEAWTGERPPGTFTPFVRSAQEHARRAMGGSGHHA